MALYLGDNRRIHALLIHEADASPLDSGLVAMF
jgi:hypothetical protein